MSVSVSGDAHVSLVYKLSSVYCVRCNRIPSSVFPQNSSDFLSGDLINKIHMSGCVGDVF